MKLYKFKNATNITDLERDLNCILTDNIWFSKIESLNDPFEGMPICEKPTNFEYLLPKFKNSVQKHEDNLKKSCIEKNKEIGILSLTKTKNNLVMWSHYADNHKGYVIEYDFDAESFNVEDNLQKIILDSIVIYSKQVKKMKIFASSYDEYLLNKSFGWKYEKEYRFISEKSGLHKYKTNCIKSIIVGANTSAIIEDYLKHIALKKQINIFKSTINSQNFGIKTRKIK